MSKTGKEVRVRMSSGGYCDFDDSSNWHENKDPLVLSHDLSSTQKFAVGLMIFFPVSNLFFIYSFERGF